MNRSAVSWIQMACISRTGLQQRARLCLAFGGATRTLQRRVTMPIRSTLLQRVVFHIQRQLAPDAKVQESAFLPDRSTGINREVDVVVRSRVGEHEVIICVECREHRRRATIEWVEQMAMKHSSLPTSKLILITAKGFTRGCLKSSC